MDQIATILSRNLRRLRAERGLSQWQLSRASGIARSTIANIELEICEGARSSTLSALASALGKPITALITSAPSSRRKSR